MNEKSSITKILASSYIGVTQTTIAFGLTHPLDLIKTRMQANPIKMKNSRSIWFDILSNHGLKGFYAGGSVNFSRAVIKELYRSPVRGIFKKFYTDILPSDLQLRHPEIRNVVTGFSMASLDMLILCPLERLKVWLMTNHHAQKSIITFMNQTPNKFELFKNLFRGLKVSYIRSIISWTSYLVAEERIRLSIISFYHLNSNQNIAVKYQILIGVLSGAVNSAVTLPFDAVKTQIQKSDSIANKNEKIVQTMRDIVKVHGLKGLYAGWQYRLPAYLIVAIITSGNIQRIDKIWNVEEMFSKKYT